MDDMTSIDAPAVRAMGQKADDLGDRLVALSDEMREWEYAGKGAVAGSVVCDHTLAGAARSWEATINGLGQLTLEFGHELRAAAGDLVENDVDVADRLWGVGKPGPGQ